jgi:hypothetical protein
MATSRTAMYGTGLAAVAAIATGLVALYGYGTYGSGPVMRASQTNQEILTVGVKATGTKIFPADPADNDNFGIGGLGFVVYHADVDGGVDAETTDAIPVNCALDACATPELTAAQFVSAIAAQTGSTVTPGRDGGIAYFVAKTAGLAGNVPIGGTISGTAAGMQGGRDPVTAGGPLVGEIPNSFDPSTTGLIAPLGSIARTADGTAAWVKVDTTNTDWKATTAF